MPRLRVRTPAPITIACIPHCEFRQRNRCPVSMAFFPPGRPIPAPDRSHRLASAPSVFDGEPRVAPASPGVVQIGSPGGPEQPSEFRKFGSAWCACRAKCLICSGAQARSAIAGFVPFDLGQRIDASGAPRLGDQGTAGLGGPACTFGPASLP